MLCFLLEVLEMLALVVYHAVIFIKLLTISVFNKTMHAVVQ